VQLFKTVRNAASWYRDPYGFLDQRIALGEYDFRVDLPGSNGAMFVGSPHLINDVVRNKSLVGGEGLRFVQPFTGPRALIVISGAEHQRRRRPIQRAFFQGNDRWMIELTETYFDLVARDLRAKQVFPLVAFYEHITLHTIIDYVLGVNESKHAEIFKLLTDWMQSFESPLWLFLKPLQRNFGSLTPWGRFLREREAVWNWIRDHIRNSTSDSRSVLARLIADRSDGKLQISEEDLVWQCIELLLFGHDTTACGSAWVVMHLLDNSMIQTQELESAHYRGACIKEALRYTPMVVHVTRQAIEDTSIGGETIRKGQKVFPCAYLAHHHRDHYENPEVFDPGRFMFAKSPPRDSYFPFGVGSRICVGMPFAIGQMEILLRRTLEFGKLGKASHEKTRAARKFIIMAPEKGGRVKYESTA
jgi:cytochrome P450